VTVWATEVPIEEHLQAWHSLAHQLHHHLSRNHDVTPVGGRRDWQVQHVMAHEGDESFTLVSPCACGFDSDPLYTADWHRGHRAHHLSVFPDVDQRTVENLDAAIGWAS
jgi:hypothetical protein